MRTIVVLASVFACGIAPLAAAPDAAATGAPRVTSLDARALVLPPRAIGAATIRPKKALAVELLLSVENYVPGGFEPILVVNGKPLSVSSGVRSADEKATVLGYVIEDPTLIPDGAALQLQLKDSPKSRLRVPARLSRARIKPLPPAAMREAGLPTLKQWLAGGAR